MEIVARARYVRISPTKMRLVAELIKKKNINTASGILSCLPNKASRILKKVLDSAIANARQRKYVDIDSLQVKNVIVDGGPMLKRYIPRALGRATMVRKRTSHITVILEES
ncbi:MAG: 50S ribosomal protein L22 [Desulfobacterota bacterium]|nr:50S ribosomal protein L22 [Thermodesulfobacteriota bacterium]MDW8002379.1 50S ribosomal protein L22 [Deltaproteobacteria bacterium]